MENQTKPGIQVSVPMEDELEFRLRTLAAKLRISRAELVRQIIIKHLPAFESEEE